MNPKEVVIAALLAGLDIETILETIPNCELKISDEDQKDLHDLGKVLRKTKAAEAAGLLDAFMDQNFSREEAMVLVAASMKPNH
jgi:hypothetical protein